jgi:type II secretory pathway component GspD/PulD (secretin)/predicted RNA binding protein with dsRBD fold (UPF0201 family)
LLVAAEAPPAGPAPAAKTPDPKPAEAKPAEKPAPKPAETPPAKPPEVAAKPAETPAAKPPEKAPAPPEKPAEKPAEKAPEKPPAKPAETPPAKPVEAPAKPAETPAKPAEAPPAKPVEKPAEKVAEKPVEKPKPAEKPAEAKAEPRGPRGKLVDKRGQAISLIMLAHPSLAERLKLTEEQKAAIAALMKEREDAVAKVQDRQKSRLIDEYDRKLAAVLTDAQRADLVANPPEPLLRFNYRFQRWIDVLEEVARQSGLSLVLPEAPPPGTFNYTDTKEFTATEAIDLINGVLINKGYTLIRREKMLVVLDLTEGIPEGSLVPQVTVEELGQRGKFEMVTLMLPLKGRSPTAVDAEIKHLLGPYGKTSQLPTTGQLRITDMAGIVKVIATVVESIPIPATPQPPVPPTPEPPELQIYNVKKGEPASVVKIVQALVPTANIVVDAKTQQLHVMAGPTIQGIVKKVLEQIEKSAGLENQPRLELYPIDETAAAQLTTTLKSIAPNAVITIEPTTGKLAAWATPEEQESIKQAAEKLAPAPAGERLPQFETYRLTRANPTTAMALLKSLLPSAKIAVDENSRTLVVIAPTRDQKVVKTLLDQLQPAQPGPDTPELKFYPLEQHTLPNAEKICAAIERISTRIQATPDVTQRRLMIMAPPPEQERVKIFLEEYKQKTPVPEKSTLVVYSVTTAQRKRFETVLDYLRGQLPGMQTLPDTEPGEMAIWAKPDQHKVIAELLEQFKTAVSPAEKHVLATYPITNKFDEALEMLKKLHPTLQFFPDSKASRVFVWAHPNDQAAIKASLEQIQSPPAAEKQPRIETYPVRGVDAKTLLTQLTALVPDAKISLDAKGEKLVVTASADDHQLLRNALGKLAGTGGGIDGAPQVEIYRLTKIDPDSFVTTLKEVVPDAKVTVETKTKSLIVVATPADQKAVKALIDEMQSTKASPDAPELRLYPLSQPQTASIVTVLTGLAPKAQVALDTAGKRLNIVASPADHATLKAAIEEIERAALAEEKNKLIAYAVTADQRKRFQAVLTTLTTELPGLQVVAGTPPGELSIWAKPSQHVVIAEMLDQVKLSPAGAEKNVLTTYPITVADATSLHTMLQTLFPNLQLVLDAKGGRILAWALPTEQAQIKAALAELQTQKPGEKRARFEAYPIVGTVPATLLTQLAELAPGVRVSLDAKTNRLIVFGTDAEQTLLKGALEKLVRPSGSGPEGTPQLEVYPLNRADSTTLVDTLQSVVPTAKITVDAATKRLIVHAVPEDQKVLKRVLEQLDSDKPAPNAPELRFYALSQKPSATVVALLTALAPKAQITLDADGKRMNVVATPADHVTIKSAVDQLERQSAADEKSRLVSYPVTPSQRKRFESMATALGTELTGMQVLADSEPGHVSIWAKPSQHVVVADILDQLKGEQGPAGEKLQLAVYPIKASDAASVTTVLKTLFPNAQVTLDKRGRKLIIWTLPSEQEKIKSAVEKLDAGDPAATQDRLMIYPIHDGSVTTITQLLEEQVPDIKLFPDATGASILAWGQQRDHQAVAKFLKDLDSASTTKPQLVVYPVGDADPKSIVAILHSLLPKVTVTVDANSGSLAATGTTRDHEMIRSVVEQMAKKNLAENEPRFVTYTIESSRRNAITSLIAILTEHFPNARFGPGLDRGQILAWGRPADQAKIKTTVEELAKETPAGASPKLVIYTLEAGGTPAVTNAVAVLRYLFPDGYFAPGSEPGKLVAFARPVDHAKIQPLLEEIGKKEPEETAQRIVVYHVKSRPVSSKRSLASRAENSALSLLRTMFPDAQVAAGADPDQIVVLARPAMHVKIKAALDDLTKEDAASTAKVAIYQIDTPGAKGVTSMMTLLQTMFPDAQFSEGTEPGKLVVVAKPDEHTKIHAAIDEMSPKEPPETAPRFATYVVDASRTRAVTSVIAILEERHPAAKFSAGLERGHILAFARPEEHKKIQDTLDQLTKNIPPPAESYRYAVYRLESGGAAAVTNAVAILKMLFADGYFAPSGEPGKIVVWARPADLPRVESILKEVGKREPAETAPRITIYQMDSTGALTATGAMSLLTTMYPEAQFSAGQEPGSIVTLARPEDHAKIKATIAEMSQKGPADKTRKIVVYTVAHAVATATSRNPYATAPTGAGSVLATLTTMFPSAKIVPGPQPDKIVAWAFPEEHKAIAEALAEIARPEPAETARTLATYTLPARPAGESGVATGITGAITLLTSMFPDARISAGAEPGKVLAWARPEDHKAIAQAIDEMAKPEPPEKARTLLTYPFKSVSSQSAIYSSQILRSMFPDAQISFGTERDKLVVWARPDDHKEIEKAIQRLTQEDRKDARRMTVYTLEAGPTGATGAIATLTTMFPFARISAGTEPGQLLVYARPDEHRGISQALKAMAKKDPATAFKAVVYTVPVSTSSSRFRAMMGDATPSSAGVVTALTAMFPSARFSQGAEPDQIVAWARPDDHKAIQEVIDELSKDEPADKARKMIVYTIPTTQSAFSRMNPYGAAAQGASGAVTALSAMFPTARFYPGSTSDKILAWARPHEHKDIEAVVQEWGRPDPPDKARRVVVYVLPAMPGGPDGTSGGSAAAANAFLTSMFPDARFSPGVEPGTVLAWARPDDHKAIASAIEQIMQKDPAKARSLVTYPFKSETERSAISAPLLRSMFPDAQITLGTNSDKLVIWARPDQQQEILKAIEAMVKKDPATEFKAVVYTVPVSTSSSRFRAMMGEGTPTSASLVTALTTMFPGAKISQGAEPDQVIAWARPDDHKAIQEVVDELSKDEPADKARKMIVYTIPTTQSAFSRMNPYGAAATQGASGAVTALSAMFPTARFYPGSTSDKILAWARPHEHKDIEAVVQEWGRPDPPDKARQVVVYVLPAMPAGVPSAAGTPAPAGTSAAAAIAFLTSMFPDARFSPGVDPGTVLAWARPDDHKAIASAIEQIMQKDPTKARALATYPFKAVSEQSALNSYRILRSMFPDAQFSFGTERDKLIVWARPADQEAIKKAIVDICHEDPLEMRRMQAYHVAVGAASGRYGGGGNAANLIASLTLMFPFAKFSTGSQPGEILAWARPDEHRGIAEAVKEFGKPEPAETAPRVESYEVTAMSADSVSTMLGPAYPGAQFSVGDDPNKLVVRARPADHVSIKASIEQIETTGKGAGKRVLVAYPFKAEDLTAFTAVLDPTLKRAMQMRTDEPRNRLMVWAEPKYQEAVQAAIDEFTRETAKVGEPTAKVYRLEWSDPVTVYQALSTLVPNAKITQDAVNRALIVHAMPEDHAKIKEAIDEIDNLEVNGQAPTLQVHRMKQGDPYDLMPVLQGLFQPHSGVQLSVDRRNESIVAFCTPSQHKTITNVITQMEKGMAADSDVKLQTYPLKDVDTYSCMETLTSLLNKQGISAEMSVEYRTDNLVVIARPEAQKVIEETLKKLRGEERTLEILQLAVLDPSTAQTAIDRLFSDGGSYRSSNPDVEVDDATEQLFIRATKEQHAKIRELLEKMGETATSSGSHGGSRPRVIRLNGNSRSQLERLQKVWPKLRDNPLEIVPPGKDVKKASAAPNGRAGKAGIQPADGPMDVPPEALPKNEIVKAEKPAAKKPAKAAAAKPWLDHWRASETPWRASDAMPIAKPAAKKPRAEEWRSATVPGKRATKAVAKPAAKEGTENPEDAENSEAWRPAASKTKSKESAVPAVRKTRPEKPAASKPQPEEPAKGDDEWRSSEKPAESTAGKPVYIIPDEGGITIRSDDPDAMAEIQNLLKSFAPQRDIGRNYTVYRLQNATASGVASILQNFFRNQGGGRFRTSSVMIVPDDRLNTIIAYASRADRTTIESLLEVLDSAEVPETLSSDRLHFIPIENTSADRIAPTLQSLYGAQVGSISVEENTNSLVVMASPAMVEQIREVAGMLDEAAGEESDHTVEILSLQNTSSERVREALGVILGDRMPSAARGQRTILAGPRPVGAPGAPVAAGPEGGQRVRRPRGAGGATSAIAPPSSGRRMTGAAAGAPTRAAQPAARTAPATPRATPAVPRATPRSGSAPRASGLTPPRSSAAPASRSGTRRKAP